MGYKEYNSRGTRSRLPLHERIVDRLRDLNDNFCLVWLALFLVVAFVGYRMLHGRPVLGGASSIAPVAAIQPPAPRIANGGELREAAAKSDAEWFHAVAAIQDLGDDVMIYPDSDEVPTDAQAAAFDAAAADYPAIREKLLQAMLEAYRVEREEVLEHFAENSDSAAYLALRAVGSIPSPEEMFPDLSSVAELERRLQYPALTLFGIESDGLAYAAVSFTPEWSVNPIGGVIHGRRVLWAGSHPDDQNWVAKFDAGLPMENMDEWLNDPRIGPDLRKPGR